MSKPKFEEKEWKVVGEFPGFFGDPLPVFDSPVSLRQNVVDTYKGSPWFMLTDVDENTFTPSIFPDNGARGFVFEAEPYPREKFGGPDMFGVDWVFVDVAGGSMEDPNKPHLLEDISEWKEKVVFPDIDSWDWEASAAMNKEYLANGRANILTFLNGCWFERLVSFIGFEDAAVALIDEDQVEDVKELIHEMTTLYMRLVDKCVEYYDLDGFSIHDDWGSQKSPFFSDAAAREVFLPEMKRFVDHVHSKGMFCDLHSCGHIEDRCDIFVEAGFDSWIPMPMNDTNALYEKFGDKIMLGIVYDKPFDPATATEEEQRAAARDFAARYCKPGTKAMYSAFYNAPGLLTQAFREELYKASREYYAD